MSASPLSIVVCAYDGLEYTRLLLESIRKHSRYEHEVVVYSDGSSDGTLAWLRKQPDIRWQHDPANRGICTAMNRAAKMATRGYLFFPNTDHVLAPGWDEALLPRLALRRVVSLQCIEPGIVPVASIFHARNCGTRWDEFDEKRFHAAALELKKPSMVPGVNYPFVISQQLWEEVGGLDELFNPGPANDPDLFYRLHLAGAEMVRVEDALLYHFSGKSSRLAQEASSERAQWHVVTERNEKRFQEKWGERYRYANGGLPDPGSEARKRWDGMRPRSPTVEVKARPKIAIDARSVEPVMQGIGVYTVNLIRSLAQMQDPPEIHCLARDPGALKEALCDVPGVACHAISASPGQGEPERKEMDALAARLGVGLFHGPAFFVPDGIGTASVVTVHDLIFKLHPEWYPAEFARHLSAVVDESVARADRVIAVSECTKRDLLTLCGPPPSKVVRVHEGLPEDVGKVLDGVVKESVRKKYAGGSPFILSIGVQQRRKNAVEMVRAFAKLKHESPLACRLVLVGGRRCEDPRLDQEIESFGAADAVTLTPHLPRSEVVALLSACELFVYPSLYEGFGLPILEAMASGAPVVCSKAGSLPEVAGEAAAFCDPQNADSITAAMNEVLSDSVRRADLIARGKEQAKRFSWGQAARETMTVYTKAIEARSNAASSIAASAASAQRARLRVAVDTRLLGQNRTGTGRYTGEILRALLAHASEAEFVLIGPAAVDEAHLPSAERVIQHVPAGGETLLDPAWEQFSLPTHLLGCDAYFAPTGIVPVARPCRAVAVVHDLGFEDHPEHYEPGLRAYLARWVRNSCLSADGIVAVSGFTAERLVEHYRLPRERIRVVHHGRPGSWRPEKAAISRPQTPADEYVLCVSSFEPNKNLKTLVDAFHRISAGWPGRLVLAGRRGRELEPVQEFIKERQLGDHVRVIADPSDQELADLYRGACLFAYPSLYEGFGLPLLEALSAGLSVMANRIASCPEVVGDAGSLVDDPSAEAWATGLKNLLDSPELAQERRRKAYARAAAFSWSKAAAQTWEAIQAAVEARK